MIPVDVNDLAQMKRPVLLTHWSETFDNPAPKGLSSPFLRRFLAFEWQARRRGGLPKAVTKAINAVETRGTSAGAPALRPGGRLLREWNGTTHVVDVHEDGFAWKGDRYRSLSAIARAITGARWSGPRFFGLNGRES